MIRTVIVDDEPIIREDISAKLSAYPDIAVIGTCGSVLEAVQMIPALQPDLLLLDVQLRDGYSFDIFKGLPDLQCAVIFITAFDNHAIRAIRIGALDYLLKPLRGDELGEALEKARRRRLVMTKDQLKITTGQIGQEKNAETTDTIALRSQRMVQIVQVDQVMFCEGAGNYTIFHLADGKHITVSRALKEYEELLPRQFFIRSHQSFLVNIRYVSTYDREGMLRLHNKQEIPVSFRKKDLVLNALIAQERAARHK